MSELAKIAISQSSDEALSRFLETVNNGFEGGKVTKTELASWMIEKIAKNQTDSVLDEIRAAHFDQVSYLEALVKNLKRAGRRALSSDELERLTPKSKKQPKTKSSDHSDLSKSELTTTQK